MYISSDGSEASTTISYLVDSLRLALSISPYSIPCDQNLGIEMKRVADFSDITTYKVRKLLTYLDPSGRLQCVSCSLKKNVVEIVVRYAQTGDYYKLSLEE